MTTIRTGNNRRRADARRAAMVARNRYAILDFETCGLGPRTNEEILAGNAKIMYFDERQTDFIGFVEPPRESIEDIARTIAAFVNGTGHLAGLSRFMDYGPEILLNRGDDASPTSVALVAEELAAMTRNGPIPRLDKPLELRGREKSPFHIAFEQIALQDALNEEERVMIEKTIALFSNPDEAISLGHADRMASMPTHDEFVESLPDGLPDDQPKG